MREQVGDDPTHGFVVIEILIQAAALADAHRQGAVASLRK